MRSQDTMELFKNYPEEFRLLTIIALTCDRDGRGRIYGCKIGESVINNKSCNMTPQRYRTAKRRLEEWGYVTFQVRGKGKGQRTFAKLTSNCIFNVNLPNEINNNVTDNQPYNNTQTTNKDETINICKQSKYMLKEELRQQTSNIQKTADQPQTHDKQESRRKKKEKNDNLSRTAFEKHILDSSSADSVIDVRDNVSMEQQEHETLIKEWGEEKVNRAYNFYSNWKKSKDIKPSTFREDGFAIRGWVFQRIKEDELKEREMKAREKIVLETEKRADDPNGF